MAAGGEFIDERPRQNEQIGRLAVQQPGLHRADRSERPVDVKAGFGLELRGHRSNQRLRRTAA